MKRIIIIIFVLGFMVSCGLDEQVLDTPVGGNALKGPNTAESVLAPVYAKFNYLYGGQDGLFNLQGVASDEDIVPFRGGTDWYDGGRYIQMHQHTWTPNHVNVIAAWRDLTQGIAKAAYAQQVIPTLPNETNSKRLQAEARAMGAFWNQWLLDLYGVAAQKKPEDVGNPNAGLSTIYKGEDAVNYILDEYNAAVSDLGTYNDVGSTRFTKAAVWALKARLFLNKPVYVDRYASQFDFTQADMDSVIANTTRVINTGDYALETKNYFSIWNTDNHNHREHIFAFDQSLDNNGSNRLAWFGSSRARHKSLTHLGVVGSDGVSLTTEFYDRWDGHHDDPRFFQRNIPDGGEISDADWTWNRGIQIGQQYGIVLNDSKTDYLRAADGNLEILPLVDEARTGLPLVYSRLVGLSSHSNHIDGARALKYEFDPDATRGQGPSKVDLPVIRIADMYLMRAEANLREGNTTLALQDVNTVRAARGASLDAAIDLYSMESERIFEFYYELQRRTDQIRFGHWEDTWTDKSNTDPTRRVFPIPQDVIDAASVQSGYLEQNQGY